MDLLYNVKPRTWSQQEAEVRMFANLEQLQ